ncbi:hypothetical protein, partial [Teichococcus deserti]|uniref:hypothetical protein n=1 Tax=Teichococcus deserti TaxID=1817963 RepID=UPI001A974BE3
MPLLVSGEVPDTIYENARPGDWVAKLSLSGLTGITDVRLTGTDANRFEARLDAAKGLVTIVPVGAFDSEAFSGTPKFAFGLQVKTASGWVDSGQSWGVSLLNVDDTPPHKLSFSAGGSVLETDVGGVIGTLFGEDRDTPKANLTYRVLWPDEAYFEVVNGNVLKLRDGVDLLREGGTTRPVMIEVSDGKQEANFLLDVKVLNTSSDEDVAAPPAVYVPPDWVSPPVTEAPPVMTPPVASPPVVTSPPADPVSPTVVPPVVSVVTPPVVTLP